MQENTKRTTEDVDLTSQPVQTELTEASEQASQDNVDESFLVDEDTEVVFKEPTSEQNPMKEVPQAAEGHVGTEYWNQDDDWEATVIGETPSGNHLQVKKRSDGAGYTLSLRDGGHLAPELQGWFTSYAKAEEAARVYLNSEWEQARAEATSS